MQTSSAWYHLRRPPHRRDGSSRSSTVRPPQGVGSPRPSCRRPACTPALDQFAPAQRCWASVAPEFSQSEILMLRVFRLSLGFAAGPPARAPLPSLFGNVPYRLSRGGDRLRHHAAPAAARKWAIASTWRADRTDSSTGELAAARALVVIFRGSSNKKQSFRSNRVPAPRCKGKRHLRRPFADGARGAGGLIRTEERRRDTRRFARLRCMGFARDERDRVLERLMEPT